MMQKDIKVSATIMVDLMADKVPLQGGIYNEMCGMQVCYWFTKPRHTFLLPHFEMR